MMYKHGEARNYTDKSTVKTTNYLIAEQSESFKVSAVSNWMEKEVHCGNCKAWVTVESRYLIGALICPVCGTPWE
ncbi:hypothetical protein ACEU2D_18045 [Brevibacillus laterosporus]|uniref:hypothetical protein n=1 Tax=Brevibacillus laterosporus TaxID=1465 RepID=UPI0035A63E24